MKKLTCVFCSKKLPRKRAIPGICKGCERAGVQGLPIKM